MEQYILEKNVNVFYVTVKAFPEGIADAFKTLENMHPSICERTFFGICHMADDGRMAYKAAVEEAYTGEGDRYGCQAMTIDRGIYLTERIVGYMDNISSIPNAFRKFGTDPRIDREAPCIEWYKNEKEMLCMVKLKQDNTIN